jgi:hypothetical protein
MVRRLFGEFEVPDDECPDLAPFEEIAQHTGWRFVGVMISADGLPNVMIPICPQCGLPMVWSHELEAFHCSHDE